MRHQPQTQARRLRKFLRESAAVIRHNECQFLPILRELDVDPIRAGMLDCVYGRFLGNVIKLRGRCCVTDMDSVIAIESAGNSKSLANVFGQTLQRNIQPICLEFRRKEAARQVASEINSFLNVMHDFVGMRDLGRRAISELVPKDLRSQRRPGQMLAETIM